MNEIEKLFGDLPKNASVETLETKEEPKEEPKVESQETPEEGEGKKNRRHRRLEEQLDNERRSNIELNKKVIELSERVNGISKPSTDIPSEWIALYGDSPEAQKAWKVQESLLKKHGEEIRHQTLREIEDMQKKEVQLQREQESFIDSKLEALEDEHNIDLTSNSPSARKARREFLEMVEKFSPKDSEGKIVGYADFDSVFGEYKNRKPSETASRAKEIASKTMQRSSSTSHEGTNDDASIRWLKENRII